MPTPTPDLIALYELTGEARWLASNHADGNAVVFLLLFGLALLLGARRRK